MSRVRDRGRTSVIILPRRRAARVQSQSERAISGDVIHVIRVRAYAARAEDVPGNDLCTEHSTSLHRSSIPPLHALA